MVKSDSLLETVRNLLEIAKAGECNQEEFSQVCALLSEHSEHMILGRFFGFSVSDYAFATLSRIQTKEAEKAFSQAFRSLDERRKQKIDELIQRKFYEEI